MTFEVNWVPHSAMELSRVPKGSVSLFPSFVSPLTQWIEPENQKDGSSGGKIEL